MKNNKTMKIIVGFAVVLSVLFVWIFMVGKNDITHTLIKQDWPSGNLSCVSKPGLYWKGFASMYKYEKSRNFYFNNDQERVKGRGWNGEDDDEDDIIVTLSRNAVASISGFVKYTLPSKCEDLISLHRVYQSADNVKHDLLRNSVIAAVKKTAPLYTAEEAKVTKIAEFRRTAEDQLTDGEYLTITEEREEKVADEKDEAGNVVKQGETQKYTVTKLRLDSLGNRIVIKSSPITAAGIKVNQFEIVDIKLDAKAQQGLDLIKEREMQRIANQTKAETAKQQAITALEEGKARVAEENANQQVEKIKAVVSAQKEKEVATLEAQKQYEVAKLQAAKAVEDAKRIKAEGEAEAAANRAKVQAGLSPQEKIEWEYKTKVGIAEALAKSNQKWVPDIMFTTGNSKSSDAMDAVGLKMLMDVSDKLSKK